MLHRIKLMVDYCCPPVWWDDGYRVGPVELSDLPITRELRDRLGRWADMYDSTLDMNYPPDSGFENVSDFLAFDDEGEQLWLSLISELSPDYDVLYRSARSTKVLSNPAELADLPPARDVASDNLRKPQ